LRLVRADLHVHTVLSPCGGLDMGAPDIVERALQLGLGIVAVTDHNTTGNVAAVQEAARGRGLLVLAGLEIQSSEDVHAVTLFETVEEAREFEAWLWVGFPGVLNRPEYFGPQILIDRENQILGEQPVLLVQGAGRGIDEIAREVRLRGGICFFSHIDRDYFSYPAILGPIPADYPVDALELTCGIKQATMRNLRVKYPAFPFLRNSDAHCLEQMEGVCTTLFRVKEASFEELKFALQGKEGREVLFPWQGNGNSLEVTI